MDAINLASAGDKYIATDGSGLSPDDPGIQVVALQPVPDIPLGYQQLTGLSGARTLSLPTGALWAIIVPEGASVRWRDDGTVPSASIGMPLDAGATMVYRGALAAIQFIEQSASATLNVAYYK